MEITHLTTVLSVLQEKGSFNKLLQRYKKELSIDAKTGNNYVCLLLVDEALQNHEILNACTVLLVDESKNDLFASPYFSFLLSLAETRVPSLIMLFLVYLSQKKKDKTWLEFESIEFFQDLSRVTVSPNDIEHFRKTHNGHHAGISSIFSIDPSPRSVWTEKEIADEFQALQSIQPEFSTSVLKLDLATLVPPVLDFADDEFQFLEFEDDSELMLTPISQFLEVSQERFTQIQQKSLSESLSPEDLRQFLFAIKDNPLVIKQIPYSSEQLVQLLSNNWSFVVEIILALHSIHQLEASQHSANHSTNGAESKKADPEEETVLQYFLSSLLALDISTQSLETIHAVCKKTDLPVEFLQKYILKCMEFCSKTKDTPTQNRHVRLVCGLIQSILKKNPRAISPVIVELQAFCLSFTHVKDAIVLYAMAKGIDNK